MNSISSFYHSTALKIVYMLQTHEIAYGHISIYYYFRCTILLNVCTIVANNKYSVQLAQIDLVLIGKKQNLSRNKSQMIFLKNINPIV